MARSGFMWVSRTRSRPILRSSSAAMNPSLDGSNSRAVSDVYASNAKPHTTSRSWPAPFSASRAASFTRSGDTVPCSGPMHTATVRVVPSASVNSPRAASTSEAAGSSESNLRRSPRNVFCTPADRRFSRIVSTNPADPFPFVSGSDSTVGASRLRCGDSDSTVNGPDTRTRLLSSNG